MNELLHGWLQLCFAGLDTDTDTETRPAYFLLDVHGERSTHTARLTVYTDWLGDMLHTAAAAKGAVGRHG